MRKVYFKTGAVRGIVIIFMLCGILSLVAIWKGQFDDDWTSIASVLIKTMEIEDVTITDWETASRGESDYWRSVHAETMTPRQIIDYLKWSNRSACQTVHYFGGHFVPSTAPRGLDGQYPICLDSMVRPSSALTSSLELKDIEMMKNKKRGNKGCIVYSFGINGEWSFDEAVSEYGCRVFSFDPSMNETDHDHSQFIHFYNLGLSDRDHVIDDDGSGVKWAMKSLDSIYRMLSTTAVSANDKQRHHDSDAVIDYLKMDIEWDEWGVLPQIIESGMLAKIRQLTVEFHLPTKFIPSSLPSAVDLNLDDYRRLVTVIKSMEHQHGMVRFESRANPWSVKTIKALDHYVGSTCFEMSFYQILPFVT